LPSSSVVPYRQKEEKKKRNRRRRNRKKKERIECFTLLTFAVTPPGANNSLPVVSITALQRKG
jgi:hypothetical protein